MLITVDGPAGVGKGTIAQMLAAHYRFVYLDTGLFVSSDGVFFN
ncbi:MAG: (d)CMP kinase [Holosporaceae bacterium]|nr:MAG: (d)CMP kinase [Holosporaceae bacterium]